MTAHFPRVAGDGPVAKSNQERQMSRWPETWQRIRAEPVALVCAFLLAIIGLAVVFAPLIAPHDPFQTSIFQRLKPVGTPGHVLGTDELGRDMLSRLLHGGRLSWFLGVTPVAIAFAIGGSLGVIAGYAGGRVNMLIMRTTDIFYAFPSVLLAVAISGAMGPGILNAMLALTLAFTPQMIRIAESATTAVRNLDYVEAARASGAGSIPIVITHVLPNVLGQIFVYATSLISVCMILASGLSFLGLGTRPPDAEWGLMLNTLRTAIYSQPMLAIMPGICIFITSLSFNLFSEGLRNILDVRS